MKSHAECISVQNNFEMKNNLELNNIFRFIFTLEKRTRLPASPVYLDEGLRYIFLLQSFSFDLSKEKRLKYLI